MAGFKDQTVSTQQHAFNGYATRGIFQLYVIAALRPANYHQKIGSISRSIQTLRSGDCTADLDGVAGRMNVLPGDSRHPADITYALGMHLLASVSEAVLFGTTDTKMNKPTTLLQRL
jgi:hypothetical protein